jgi:NAD(P)-dependent dehydrogenase (short-subunit alcohol dehydrogenase family)
MSTIQSLFDLHGQVALVTGGAGLLGAEFTHTLAEAGAQVVIADRNEDAARQITQDITAQGYTCLAAQTDITSPESTQEVVTTILEKYGRLDILVNCAALDPKFDPKSLDQPVNESGTGAFENFPLSAWQQALDVNLTGMFLCCQAAVRPMLAQGKGVIINLCSMYGLVGPDQRLYQHPDRPMQFKPVYYSVTKAGVLGLTRYLATYYARKNIRVNALTPGGVFNEHDEIFLKAYAARAVMGRMANKDEMNGALLFLASDASSYMTGANLVVDGGWTAW